MSTAKVFLVTQGDYSDYSVCGVFSTHENAVKYAAMLNADWSAARVEEYTLDEGISRIDAGLHPYRVFFKPRFADEICEVRRDEPRGFPETAELRVLQKTYKGENVVLVMCWAEHDQAAIKIAADKRRQWLAEQA